MPGDPIIPVLRERLASLETWRDEHKLQHNREVQKSESSLTRKIIIIAALIGLAGAIIGGVITSIVLHLLSG